MNATDLIAALNLPASAQVERRVPKKLLLENGAPTAADRRHINNGSEAPHLEEFRQALALERQPHGNLRALYQGWMDTLIAFKAARLTGSFKPAAEPEQAAARQEALRECARLETEMKRLRAAAGKEKQMARKVELNMELKRIEVAHASARAKL